MENEIMENIAEVADEIKVEEVLPAVTEKGSVGGAIATGGVLVLAGIGAAHLVKKGINWLKAKKKARDLNDKLEIPGDVE